METVQYAAKRNTLMVYLLVDSSGSMEIDGRMKDANKIIDTTIRKLRAITDETDKAELAFCAYSYALVTKRIGAGPTPGGKFVWYEQTPKEFTCMGAALSELDKALDYCKGSIYQPVILMISDGNSIDDITAPLDRLQKNPVFENSYKFGISFDPGCEEDLAAVVGNGYLIHIQDIEGFYEKIEMAVKEMIRGQESGAAENTNTQSEESPGNSEEMQTSYTEDIPFINHWSESDWL